MKASKRRKFKRKVLYGTTKCAVCRSTDLAIIKETVLCMYCGADNTEKFVKK